MIYDNQSKDIFVKKNSLISFSNKDSKLNNTSDSMLIRNNNQAVNICIAAQFNEAVAAGETDYILGKVSVPEKRPKIVQTTLSFTGTAIISLRVETNGNIIVRVLYGSVPKDYAAWFAILYLCV